jgi:glutathione S-transferase
LSDSGRVLSRQAASLVWAWQVSNQCSFLGIRWTENKWHQPPYLVPQSRRIASNPVDLCSSAGRPANGDRISTNYGIARFLDERHPEPPLFPADPARRAAVEEAERWANDTLQMAARRIPGAALVRDPATLTRSSGDGRMGYLLYKRELMRRLIVPRIIGGIFATSPAADGELLAELSVLFDRVDGWIADGVIGGEHLNAADFLVAPSLALILYRPDVMPMFEGRPALELVDRLLPEPARTPSKSSDSPHELPEAASNAV